MKSSIQNQSENRFVFVHAPFCLTRNLPNGNIEIHCLSEEPMVYEIDGVAAQVWKKLDGATSAQQIVSGVLNEFDVTESRARQDVTALLEQLKFLGLVEEA